MSVPKAGALAKASDWTTVFPVDTDDWTTYTPGFSQSVSITKTVNYARYTKVGRTVTVQVGLTATSAGTANNSVAVSLPVTSASHYIASLSCIGNFVFNDAGTSIYAGSVIWNSSTTVTFRVGGGFTATLGQTGGGFTAAVASGDQITFTVTYESAS